VFKEYFKDMEVTMIRAKIEKDNEVTVARFLSGMNSHIRDIVKLQEYIEMEDSLHKATQVENISRGKVSQEGALPTLTQVGRTSPGKRNPHPPNLLR